MTDFLEVFGDVLRIVTFQNPRDRVRHEFPLAEEGNFERQMRTRPDYRRGRDPFG